MNIRKRKSFGIFDVLTKCFHPFHDNPILQTRFMNSYTSGYWYRATETLILISSILIWNIDNSYLNCEWSLNFGVHNKENYDQKINFGKKKNHSIRKVSQWEGITHLCTENIKVFCESTREQCLISFLQLCINELEGHVL